MAAFLALVAAVCFALAAALQQRGQFTLAQAGAAVKGPAGLVRLLVVPAWLLGTLVLLGGYAVPAHTDEVDAERHQHREDDQRQLRAADRQLGDPHRCTATALRASR